MAKTLDLERILHRQGFGTRKMCRILIINEDVTVNGEICDDPDAKFALDENLHFTVNGEGQLVTDDGYAVEPAISIPQDMVDVSISKSGQVQVTTQGQTAPQVVGQLELATFFNEAGLEAIGDNLLLETAASGPANVGAPGEPGFGTLMQGYTEASNVDAVSEITALIVAQRAYEMNSKVITTADEMLSVSAQVKS